MFRPGERYYRKDGPQDPNAVTRNLFDDYCIVLEYSVDTLHQVYAPTPPPTCFSRSSYDLVEKTTTFIFEDRPLIDLISSGEVKGRMDCISGVKKREALAGWLSRYEQLEDTLIGMWNKATSGVQAPSIPQSRPPQGPLLEAEIVSHLVELIHPLLDCLYLVYNKDISSHRLFHDVPTYFVANRNGKNNANITLEGRNPRFFGEIKNWDDFPTLYKCLQQMDLDNYETFQETEAHVLIRYTPDSFDLYAQHMATNDALSTSASQMTNSAATTTTATSHSTLQGEIEDFLQSTLQNTGQEVRHYEIALQFMSSLLQHECGIATDLCHGVLVGRRVKEDQVAFSYFSRTHGHLPELFLWLLDQFHPDKSHQLFDTLPPPIPASNKGGHPPSPYVGLSLIKGTQAAKGTIYSLMSFLPQWLRRYYIPFSLCSKGHQILLSLISTSCFLSIELRVCSRFSRQGIVLQSKHPSLYVKVYNSPEVFTREINALSSLSKERVPTLLGTGTTGGGQKFAVMTGVGEAFDRELTDDEIQTFYDQVLHPIYQRSYHHHDLYPGNITHDASGKFYLIDFGEAVASESCQHIDNCPDLQWLRQHNVHLPTAELGFQFDGHRVPKRQ
ncbi:hypothetical protein NMY22_g12363 [Coprinellus aureogranulatus]|nr:hypothetical protein NMY22_g12363 [Coprinellus aureogranulatus]